MYKRQISNYASQDNRELFESSFVRYTHDKPDLTQEEVDQYIVLSAEVVIASNIQVRVERLQELLDQAAEETEGKRMAMSLVELGRVGVRESHGLACISSDFCRWTASSMSC